MKMWYNGQPFHSLPSALLYADKFKIKQELGSNYDILTSNWPMPPNRTSGKYNTSPTHRLKVDLLGKSSWKYRAVGKFHVGNYFPKRKLGNTFPT